MKSRSWIFSCFSFFMLTSCGDTLTHLEEVPFNGGYFGVDQLSIVSLERSRDEIKIYYREEGSDKKLYFDEEGFLTYYFPDSTDLTRLDTTAIALIDTSVRDSLSEYPPDRLVSTLYVNPRFVSKQTFDQIVRFAKDCYSKEDDKNKLLNWLNIISKRFTLPSEKFVYDHTIYALVYADIEQLHPELFTQPAELPADP